MQLVCPCEKLKLHLLHNLVAPICSQFHISQYDIHGSLHGRQKSLRKMISPLMFHFRLGRDEDFLYALILLFVLKIIYLSLE